MTTNTIGNQAPATYPVKTASTVRAKTLWQRIRASWFLYLMLLPSFALLVVFTYYPAGVALIESLFRWNPGIRNEFIGLLNFRQVLTDDVFWLSWRNVLIIALWKFSVPFVIPILVAEAIYNLRSRAAKDVYRMSILVPILVPGIVTMMLWKWLYTAPDGGINLILKALGHRELVTPFLTTPRTALPALLFMGFPWVVGTEPLIYLAGLLNIPSDVLDAALIDGCSTARRILTIDLPHLLPQLRLFLVFGIIGVLQSWGGPLAMTGGGPNNLTLVPGLYLYGLAFGLSREEQQNLQMGAACAVGVLIFVVIAALTYLANKYTRTSGTEYEA